MAIRDIFKISRKTFINPVGWLDYNFLKEQNRTIWGVLKATFSIPKPQREESFTAAMKRLNLTEADVVEATARYRQFTWFFVICGLLSFIYTFYLLFRYGTFLGWILGIVVTGLFLSQAFKFDFWYLQMRERKLGLTFEDWKHSLFGADKGKTS